MYILSDCLIDIVLHLLNTLCMCCYHLCIVHCIGVIQWIYPVCCLCLKSSWLQSRMFNLLNFQARTFNLKLCCSFFLTSDLELWTYLQREELQTQMPSPSLKYFMTLKQQWQTWGRELIARYFWLFIWNLLHAHLHSHSREDEIISSHMAFLWYTVVWCMSNIPLC